MDRFLSSIFIIQSRKTARPFSNSENLVQERVGHMPVPSSEADYWRNYLMKRNYYDITKEEAEAILNVRIQFLQNYFERLFSNQLTEKELNMTKPKNYKGPYLPTYQELKVTSDLEIYIDWNVPKHQRKLGSVKLHGYNPIYLEKLLHRWIHFQKEYKIYDLRPLLGERCGLVRTSIDTDEIEVIFYRFLKKYQYMNFLIYMAKDTPELTLNQVSTFLGIICDLYENGKIDNFRKKVHLSGLEYHLMNLIFDRFGSLLRVEQYLSFLIGKRCYHKFSTITRVFGYYRTIPFKDGPWTRDENLKLLKLARRYSRARNIKEFLTIKERLPWTTIFYKFKNRRYMVIRSQFYILRQRILDAITVKEKKKKAKLRWIEDQTVKLIELIYDLDVKSSRDIDWYKMAEHFPGYTALFVSGTFNTLVRSRVPANKQKCFENVVEYLYHKIKPIYKLCDVQRKERKHEVELLLDLQASENDISEDISAIFEEGVIIQGSGTTTPNPSLKILDPFKKKSETSRKTPISAPNSTFSVQSIEQDESIWQDVMKEHGYEWTYPESLQKKLKFMDLSESDSEEEDDPVRKDSRSNVSFGRRDLNSSINSEEIQEITRNSENVQEFSRNSEDFLDKSSDLPYVPQDQSDTTKNLQRKDTSKRDKRKNHGDKDLSLCEDELLDDIFLNYESELENYESELEDSDIEIEEPKPVRKKHKKKKAKKSQTSNAIDLALEPNDSVLEPISYQKKSDKAINHPYCGNETNERERKKQKKLVKDYKIATNDVNVESEQDIVFLECTPSHKPNTTVPKLKRSKNKKIDNIRDENDASSLVINELPEKIPKKKKKKKHNRHIEDHIESAENILNENEQSSVVTENLLNPIVKDNSDNPHVKKQKKQNRSHEHNICDNGNPVDPVIEISESMKRKNNKSKLKNKPGSKEDELNSITADSNLYLPVLESQESVTLKHKKKMNRKRDYESNNLNDMSALSELKENTCVREYTECLSVDASIIKQKKYRNAEIDISDRILNITIDDSTKEKLKRQGEKRKRDNDDKNHHNMISQGEENSNENVNNYADSSSINNSVFNQKSLHDISDNILEITIDDPTEEKNNHKEKKRKRKRDQEDDQPDDIRIQGENLVSNTSIIKQKSKIVLSNEIIDITDDELPVVEKHKNKKKRKRDYEDDQADNIRTRGENFARNNPIVKQKSKSVLSNEIIDITDDEPPVIEKHKNKKKRKRDIEDDLNNIGNQCQDRANKNVNTESLLISKHKINDKKIDVTADEIKKHKKKKKKQKREYDDKDQPRDIVTDNNSNRINDKSVKIAQHDEDILTKKEKKRKHKELEKIQDKEIQNFDGGDDSLEFCDLETSKSRLKKEKFHKTKNLEAQKDIEEDLDQIVSPFSKKSKKRKKNKRDYQDNEKNQ